MSDIEAVYPPRPRGKRESMKRYREAVDHGRWTVEVSEGGRVTHRFHVNGAVNARIIADSQERKGLGVRVYAR